MTDGHERNGPDQTGLTRNTAISVGLVLALSMVLLTVAGLFTSWVDEKFNKLDKELDDHVDKLDSKLDVQGVKLDDQGSRLQGFELRLRLIEEQGRWRQGDRWTRNDMKDWVDEFVRKNEGLEVPKVRSDR